MTLKKKLLAVVLVLLSGIIVTGVYINGYSKNYGYEGLTDVIKTYFHNRSLSKKVIAKQLNITLSKSDYNFIKAKRDVALDRGVQINVGDNYVECDINFDNNKSKGEIRLKGHMTDHLQGNKWSYRIKTDSLVQGMYRFSIQHPGTRNYIYEWIYHQLLKNEDVIHLNYDFINVVLNGNDLGIYALEEHFGQHVLDRNDRPKGAILRWNPELYWDWRIDELQGEYIDEQYSHFSSSYVEPYDKGTVMANTALLSNYQKGAYLLEMFRRGKMTTSEVFDIERMAKFHVIIDLVGGHHSLDWSDVKFYYNSESNRIEPVGYESFSIRKTEKIAGQRVPLNYEKISFNYHNQLFSDPIFFESYIKNMERIVSEKYINEFMSKIQQELDKKMGIIAKEWAYRKVTFEGYYENIRLIRNNISLPKPFHAFIVPDSSKKLRLSLAPVSDFPVQIIGIKRKSKIKDLPMVINIPAKARDTYTKYFNVALDNPFGKKTNLYLIAKIPGSSHTFEVIINEFPAYKSTFSDIDSSQLNVSKPDSSIIAITSKKWKFRSRNTVLNHKLFVPKGVTLYLYPNESLTIGEYGRLRVDGELVFQGYDEDQSVELINKSNESIFLNKGSFFAKYVRFSGKPLIVANKSKIIINNSVIYDMQSLVKLAEQSDVVINKCSSGNLQSVGEFNESIVLINHSNFSKGKLFIESNGSFMHLTNTKVEKFNKMFALDYGSSIKTHEGWFNRFDTIATLGHGSSILAINTNLSDAGFGFWWDVKSNIQSRQFIKLYQSKTQKINQLMVI